MDPVNFSRKPYNVTYFKDGVKHTIRRRPPPKAHNMWPQDVVEISSKKNDDWDAGDKVTVTGINARQPNVLQVENSDGEKTFLSYRDVELKETRGGPDGIEPKKLPINNRYLIWP